MTPTPIPRLNRPGLRRIRAKRKLHQPERVTPLHYVLWAALCVEGAYILYGFVFL